MKNINFAILFLLSLISRLVVSTPTCTVTTSPSYCPFQLASSSDIPSAASSYNVLNKQKYMNGSVQSFQTTLELLSQITDPILNASSISSTLETIYDSTTSVTSANVNNWFTVLNNYYRIDILGPTSTYQTNYNTLVSMKGQYVSLYNQGVSLYQAITTIQNNLNGVSLTSAQTAQLAIYNDVKLQLNIINGFFNAAQLYLSTDILYASDLIDLPEFYVNGDCEIDSCRDALISYNEYFTEHAYDFYLSLNSLNQLTI